METSELISIPGGVGGLGSESRSRSVLIQCRVSTAQSYVVFPLPALKRMKLEP